MRGVEGEVRAELGGEGGGLGGLGGWRANWGGPGMRGQCRGGGAGEEDVGKAGGA